MHEGFYEFYLRDAPRLGMITAFRASQTISLPQKGCSTAEGFHLLLSPLDRVAKNGLHKLLFLKLFLFLANYLEGRSLRCLQRAAAAAGLNHTFTRPFPANKWTNFQARNCFKERNVRQSTTPVTGCPLIVACSKVYLPYGPVCLSVGRLVCLSVIIS